MIELSAALVIVAAIGAFVASRYFAMKLQLAKPDAEHVSMLARIEDRLVALEGAADRLTELEYALDAHKQKLDAHKQKLEATGVELGEKLELARVALNETVAKAEKKYDGVITHGINEMREIVKPIDAWFKRMINGRANAALPTKGTSHG